MPGHTPRITDTNSIYDIFILIKSGTAFVSEWMHVHILRTRKCLHVFVFRIDFAINDRLR